MTFEEGVREGVIRYGGWYNAHAHIDRSFVMDSSYIHHADMNAWDVAGYSLEVKQHTTGALHEGAAYTEESLYTRMSHALNESITYGVRQLDSFIDTTGDCIKTRALDVALQLQEEYSDRIIFRVGAYPIFGFKDNKPERWETFVDGASRADFIGTLPERDAREYHIGFREHFRRVLLLANELGNKEVHLHVDQSNDPSENGTETLIEAVRWLRPYTPTYPAPVPTVWAVHALSVSSYNDERFQKILQGLRETNIGVIVCPTATLSNYQNRSINVPMHNSITRVLDFALADIPLRFGTDNVQDFFLPNGTMDMYHEVVSASNMLRFYNYTTWAKFGAGVRINQVDKMKIRAYTDQGN